MVFRTRKLKRPDVPRVPKTGRQRTEAITKAVVGWLVKKKYSCQIELAILPWGKRRVDVVGLNLKRDIIVIEVKQCWQDFIKDTKWSEYLPFCNVFYFGLPYDLWEARQDQILDAIYGTPAGIIVLSEDGYAYVAHNPKRRVIDSTNKRDLIVRLAWRGGVSARTTRRYPVYL